MCQRKFSRLTHVVEVVSVLLNATLLSTSPKSFFDLPSPDEVFTLDPVHAIRLTVCDTTLGFFWTFPALHVANVSYARPEVNLL